jgi:ferredoxin-type protein NapF
MTKGISRRQFLRGDFSDTRALLRPPWSVDESDFVERCTRCGDCIRACPQKILQSGDAGFPVVNFATSACTFCGACVAQCTRVALLRPSAARAEKSLPWQIKAVITDDCLARRGVTCEVCRDQCALHAITFRPRAGQIPRPEVLIATCTGCGACVRPCPVGALQMRRPAEPASEESINTVEVVCT